MKLANLSRLAMKHVRNQFTEELYLKTNKDHTRPTTIYGIVNERCNYRCRYCEFWRMKEYKDEMTIEQWQTALASLKDFIGPYHIEFSGGEPFIKKGFVDLIEWCHQEGIHWGATTNGSALTEKMVKRIVGARPFNINVSIDGNVSEIHDYVRGIDGSLGRITRGMKWLIEERNNQGLDFPIIIKPTVHAKNLHLIPEMAQWVVDLGASVVNFQPVDRWTQETYDELWIEEDRMDELEAVSKQLIEQKKAGMPILNSELILSLWPDHFREKSAPKEAMPCRVGMRNYFIRPDGNVEVCWFFPPIGNVKEQTAEEIWKGHEAKTRRKETVECEKLCLFTCLSQKTLTDKVKMGLTLFRNKPAQKSVSV